MIIIVGCAAVIVGLVLGFVVCRYVSQDKVRILDMDGEQITNVLGIIDEYVDKDNRVFFLNRRHTLQGDTLTVETYTTIRK